MPITCPKCRRTYPDGTAKCIACYIWLKQPVQPNVPKCPTCQSTKIKKISDLKKATGFMMAGIFSSNFGKTMECENCGYKW